MNEWSETLYILFTNYVGKILIPLKGTLPQSSVKLKRQSMDDEHCWGDPQDGFGKRSPCFILRAASLITEDQPHTRGLRLLWFATS